MYQALYRKYRPKTFAEVAGQEHISGVLRTQLASGRISHAYLFTGSRGTGKTTCARLLAKAVNCEALSPDGEPCNACPSCIGIDNGSILDVLEMDAASNNGVDHVRALREEAGFTPASVKMRVYIVDEVHMLSGAAFNALLKIMEEPPAHLLFILATTELHKVPATILSRCQRFSFRRLSAEDIARRLLLVAEKERIELREDGAELIARLADGAMRDGLSILDQCAAASPVVDEKSVRETVGTLSSSEVPGWLEQIASADTAAVLETFSELYSEGRTIAAMLGGLSSALRDILVILSVKDASNLLSLEADLPALKDLARHFTPEGVIRSIRLIQDTLNSLSRSKNPRIDAELCLIRLCTPELSGDISALEARVATLEEALKNGPPLPSTPAKAAKKAPGPAPEPPAFSDDTPPPPSDYDAPPPSDYDAPPPPGDSDAPPDPGTQEPPDVPPVPAPGTEKQEIKLKSFDPGEGADLWERLKQRVKTRIGIMENIYLSNPEMASPFFSDGSLDICVQEDFIYNILNTKDVLSALAECAQELTGSSLRVSFRREKPRDPMDELIEFGKNFNGFTVK